MHQVAVIAVWSTAALAALSGCRSSPDTWMPQQRDLAEQVCLLSASAPGQTISVEPMAVAMHTDGRDVAVLVGLRVRGLDHLSYETRKHALRGSGLCRVWRDSEELKPIRGEPQTSAGHAIGLVTWNGVVPDVAEVDCANGWQAIVVPYAAGESIASPSTIRVEIAEKSIKARDGSVVMVSPIARQFAAEVRRASDREDRAAGK